MNQSQQKPGAIGGTSATHRKLSISVIIPTRDRPELLAQALASVCSLRGGDIELEVIVSDNDSTSDVQAVAARFGARFICSHTPGPSATRNAGLAIATGEFVAFLDDDDLWQPEHLRPHLAFLADHAGFAAVVSQVTRTDMDCHPQREPYPSTLPADGKVFQELLLDWLQIGALVARTQTVRALGGFDESLAAGEDWDFMLRLALAARIGFVAVPTVLFRSRPAGLAWEDRQNHFRAGINARVFRRNLLRAGAQRPPARIWMRAYMRYLGKYVSYLMGNLSIHLQYGDKQQARRALWWAARVSPLHTLGYLRRSYWRSVILRTLV